MRALLATVAAYVAITDISVGAEGKGADKVTPADFYVAVSGRDTNPGTAKAPFATFATARDAVRGKIKGGLTKDIVVQIRGGTYLQSETLTFGPEDSGTEKFSITYTAAPGEKVVLSGGRKITGWKKGTNEIWTADIPDVKAGKPALRSPEQGREGEGGWYFRQLFVNGQRAVRARTPNADDMAPWWKIKSTDIKPGAPDQNSVPITVSVDQPIRAWKNAADVELIYLNNNDASRKRVGAVNAAAQTFTLPPPHQWPRPISAQAAGYPGSEQSCYLENALEMLDRPGEWYLDRTTGALSYWPRPGEDLERAEVIAPVVQNTLLAVKGIAQAPVRNLRFKGLHVQHVDWLLPPFGFANMFGCLQLTSTDAPRFYWIDAAVSFHYALACTFTDGGVAHAGGIGLGILSGCAQETIEGNLFYDLGGGGIVAGGLLNRDVYKWAEPVGADDHKGHRIANNHIHHCGTDYFGAIGVFMGVMHDSVVAHNLIHDIAYCGIVEVGNESPMKLAKDNIVEYNHIYRTMQVSADGAGLYTTFPHLGSNNIIRANLIQDGTEHWAAAGLYLDLSCYGVIFDHNVVYGKHYAVMNLCDKAALTANTWSGNLLLPNKNEKPPEEFIEVMQACAGLEPAYRKALQGTDPQPCEIHVLEGSDATRRAAYLNSARNETWGIQVQEGGTTWQFNLPEQGRGVVYRANPEQKEAGKTVVLKLRKLDPAARYSLKAYSGQIEPARAYNGGDAKIQVPMVQKIGPAPDLGLPDTMTGRELMEKGLTLKDAAGVIWVAYRKTQP